VSRRMQDPEGEVAHGEDRTALHDDVRFRVSILEKQRAYAGGPFELGVSVRVVVMVVGTEGADNVESVLFGKRRDRPRSVRGIDYGCRLRSIISDEVGEVPVSAGVEGLDEQVAPPFED